MNPDALSIIFAHDEPEWVKQLNFADTPTLIQNLPYGDAWIATADAVIAVERKTMSDLMASIKDGRLFAQAADMVKGTPWSYVVVNDVLAMQNGCIVAGGKVTAWTWASIRGALLKVQEMGCGTMITLDDRPQGYKQALIQLANRDRGKITVERKRDVVERSPGEKLLCSVAGISDSRAKQLLDACGSAVYALVMMSSRTLPNVQIKGFPWKQAERNSRLALGLEEYKDGSWDELTVHNRNSNKGV